MNHHRLLTLGLFAVVMLATRSAPAATDAAVLAQIPARMQQFIEDGTISGAVTVVGRRDGIASFEAVGLRDIETRQPMTKDTLFRIASMTKPVTSLGIMILADEGKLGLDDEVEKHLPEFRGQMLVSERTKDRLVLCRPAKKITLRHLLTHTSGLPRPPEGLADLYAARNHTLAEGIMAMSQRPLEFEPGSKWAYCNTGIDTLGRVIEVVSGMPYETFLKQRIFAPLGMNDTTFYPDAGQMQRLAMIYDQKEGKLQPAAKPIIGLPPGAKHPIPAGGLCSTGGDLARLYQMMLNNGQAQGKQIVSPKILQTMTSLQTGDLKCGFVDGMGFGLGVGVVREPAGVTAMLSPGSFGHGGAFGTQGWMDPKQDLFVILLIQRVGLKNGDASPLRQALQELAVQAIRGK